MQSLNTLLAEDTRAVAPVIGFILLFGIGVVAFSGYQAVQVPQQNAETEFQHQENLQNDLIVLRNAISRAGQQNQNQFESVRLGTTYRERILALNPPAPAGTLRTRGPHTIIIDNGSDRVEVESQFLEYQDGYNELDADPIYYEHSVLYLETETGNRVFFEDQNIVRENSDVVITALQHEFSRSATGRVTIELYPTEAGDQLPTGQLDVTLPTRLPESYWQEQLGGTDPISNINYNDPGGNIKEVTFTVNSSDLEFNTVGINDAPDRTGAVSDMDGGGGGSDGTNGGSTAADLVQYVDGSGSAARSGPESRVDFDIENTGDLSVQITDIEIDSPAGNLVTIREGNGGSGSAAQHEVFIDSSTAGIYEASGDISAGADPGTNAYELGNKVALTQTGTLDSAETAQTTLAYFRKNNADRVSAADKEINITLYFQDGSSLSFSFTPPGY